MRSSSQTVRIVTDFNNNWNFLKKSLFNEDFWKIRYDYQTHVFNLLVDDKSCQFVCSLNEIYQHNDRQESAHDAYIHLSVWVSLDAR